MIGLMTMCPAQERYSRYLLPLIESAKKFFPKHEFIVFTEDKTLAPDVTHIHQEDLGWPAHTLMRYHMFWKNRDILRKYDFLFYIDVDTIVVSPIKEMDICGYGITATQHPGFIDSDVRLYERRVQSTAYIGNDDGTYYQGAFQGGITEDFLLMSKMISLYVDIDESNGIRARWLDESHLNRYLYVDTPIIALGPEYLMPEDTSSYPWLKGIEPKIMHLWKPNQESWKGPTLGEQI